MRQGLAVEILGLYADPSSGAATILLGPSGAVERVLPVIIGPAEARAIAIGLSGEQPPRPGTHDLLLAALAAVGATLRGVEVVGLEGGTFLAELDVDAGGDARRIDARPSDGIALAVRADVPVTVDRDIFERASVPIVHRPGEPFDDDQIEQIVSEFHDFLTTAQPEQFAEPDEPDDTDDPDQ